MVAANPENAQQPIADAARNKRILVVTLQRMGISFPLISAVCKEYGWEHSAFVTPVQVGDQTVSDGKLH